MALIGKIFGDRKKTVVIDLTKPYRDLLAGQANPVVRGVILHSIASMDNLQNPDVAERALLGEEVHKTIESQLAAAQLRQATNTPKDTALSAIVVAASFIMIRAAGKVLYGEDMVIRDISGSDGLKKAAMCYAFGLFICKTLLTAFMQAGIISIEDEQVSSGEWKVSLFSCFPLASLGQKNEIYRLGGTMFQEMSKRSEC